jgi:hypothetical protein
MTAAIHVDFVRILESICASGRLANSGALIRIQEISVVTCFPSRRIDNLIPAQGFGAVLIAAR